MPQLVLSLGTNLGNKKNNLEYTIQLLEEHLGVILSKSSIYETEPWGYKSKNNFFNLVLVINTELSTEEVLNKIKTIEKEMGRIRPHEKYSDRIIDIDILFYDDLVISSDKVQIPHPRLQERKFVLVPLAEILPNLIHPVLNKIVLQMIEECNDKSFLTKL